MSESDIGNNPKIVYRAANDIEAASIVCALAEQGIPGTVTGSFTSGFITEAPGEVSVIVRESDFVEATKIIEPILAGNNEVDWESVDVGQPEE